MITAFIFPMIILSWLSVIALPAWTIPLDSSLYHAQNLLKNKNLCFIEYKGQFLASLGQEQILYSFKSAGMELSLTSKGFRYVFIKRLERKSNPQLSPSDQHKITKDSIIIHELNMQWIGANPKARIEARHETGLLHNYYLSHCPESIKGARSFEEVIYYDLYKNIDLRVYFKEGKLKYDWIIRPGGKISNIQFKYIGHLAEEVTQQGGLKLRYGAGYLHEEPPVSYQNTAQNSISIASSYSWKKGIFGFQIKSYDPGKTLIIDPSVVWDRSFGGESSENVSSIQIDDDNNIYLVGDTRSETNIATPGSYKPVYQGGNYDGFLIKLNPEGQRVWATYYGGNETDFARAMVLDKNGNIYITGFTRSTSGIVPPGIPSFQPLLNGTESDAFLVKFNNEGVIQWAPYYGTNENEQIFDIAIDSEANIYLTGSSGAPGLNTPGLETFVGEVNNIDAFLVKFNNDGQRLWATYFGGSGEDIGISLAIDNSESIYMLGVTGSNDISNINNTYQTTYQGNSDAFVVKYNKSTGIRLWTTYFGGSEFDSGKDIILDANKNIYITGYTDSPNLGFRGFQNAINGFYNFFIAKLDSTGSSRIWTTYYGVGEGFKRIGGGKSLALKDNGLYLVGLSESPGMASGGFQNEPTGSNAFILKLDTNGRDRIWASYYDRTSGNRGEVFETIAINSCGKTLLIAGEIYAAGAPLSIANEPEMFLTKILDETLPIPGNGFSILGDTLVCTNAPITYQINNPDPALRYTWSVPQGFEITSGQNSPILTVVATSEAQAGQITATDNNSNCSFSNFIDIDIFQERVETPQVFQNCNVLSTNANGNLQWLKDNQVITGAINSQLEITETGVYQLQVIERCQTLLSEPIEIKPLTLDSLPTYNAFTPNGDEKNQTFKLPVALPTNSQLQVYNRWGKLVYASKNYQNDWQGGNLPKGVYYYIISNPCLAKPLTGWVELLK